MQKIQRSIRKGIEKAIARGRFSALALLLAALPAALLLAGCAGGAAMEANSTEFFAMDTYMTLRAYGADDALLSEARDWVYALEDQISVTAADSELARINREGTGVLTGEAEALARRALELCSETGGALDLTIYPVVRSWGFTTGNYRVPEAEELAELLEWVDYRRVSLAADGTVTLPSGAELDLGSVTKGYTGDRLCALLAGQGVGSALLDLGGNIQALGGKPDGSDWKVGIRNPEGDGILGVLPVRGEAVITSGGYERYFIDDSGILRWHIIDPADGYPARNGLISVTVVGTEGVYCDALSTALYVMGEEKAAAFWRSRRDFEALLVTEDGRLLLTPGAAQRFAPVQDLPYILEVISDAEN